MKTVMMIMILVCNLMAISAQDAAWVLDAQTDLNKAFNKARDEHKMILLVVVKEDCSWCEKMVFDTLKDENIQENLKNMITVIADINDKLPSGFKAKLTPTVFFIDPKSKKSVLEGVGFIEKGSFLMDIVSASEKMEE